MSEIRVLFLMEDLCFGGTQRQMLQLAERLDRGLFEVHMLTLTGLTDLDDAAEAGAIRLHHIGSSRRVDPLFFLKLPFWLRRLRPDGPSQYLGAHLGQRVRLPVRQAGRRGHRARRRRAEAPV